MSPHVLQRQQQHLLDRPLAADYRPLPIMVGAGIVALRQGVQFAHIGPEDRAALLSPAWLDAPEEFAPGDEHERHVALLDELAKAQAAYQSVEGDLRMEAKQRVLLTPEDAKSRPRLNADKLREERAEAAVRSELQLLRFCDEVTGSNADQLDAWESERADAAREAREEAEEAERVAAALRARPTGSRASCAGSPVSAAACRASPRSGCGPGRPPRCRCPRSRPSWSADARRRT